MQHNQNFTPTSFDKENLKVLFQMTHCHRCHQFLKWLTHNNRVSLFCIWRMCDVHFTRNHLGAMTFVGYFGSKPEHSPQLRQTQKVDQGSWLCKCTLSAQMSCRRYKWILGWVIPCQLSCCGTAIFKTCGIYLTNYHSIQKDPG